MSECVLTSQGGAAARQKIVDAARRLGGMLRPRELQFCEFHRNNHLIEITDADVVDARYGRAPVDVPVSEKPDIYVRRSYCRVCYAYHTADELCGGQRLAAVEWEKKEI